MADVREVDRRALREALEVVERQALELWSRRAVVGPDGSYFVSKAEAWGMLALAERDLAAVIGRDDREGIGLATAHTLRLAVLSALLLVAEGRALLGARILEGLAAIGAGLGRSSGTGAAPVEQ